MGRILIKRDKIIYQAKVKIKQRSLTPNQLEKIRLHRHEKIKIIILVRYQNNNFMMLK